MIIFSLCNVLYIFSAYYVSTWCPIKSLGGRHPDTVGLLGQSVGAVDTAIEWDSAASRRRRPLTAPCLPAVHQAMARALQHEQQAAYSYFQRRGRVSRVVLG